MRVRSHTAWSIGILLLVAALLLSPRLAQPAHAATPNDAAAQHALDWLRGQQLDDGSFAAGSPGFTADVALAFESAGINPRSVRSASGADAIAYLTSAPGVVDDAGVAGKVVLVLTAINEAPEASGQDLTGAINQSLDSATGWYGTSFYGSLYAVLGLTARSLPVDPAVVTAIFAAQQPDGSWGFNGDPTPGTGDSNTTAIAVQTLAALGEGQEAAQHGLAYLESLQDPNGAVAYDSYSLANGGGDANSTALAIQAVLAVGGDPATAAGGDLTAALASFQNPSGAFQFQPAFPDDSPLATAQAVPALGLQALPLAPVPVSNPLADAVLPAAPIAGCDYHDATQHNLCDAFRAFWSANGGLANFGYALSEPFDDNGLTVQYFERARFELHPENAGTPYEVLLTRVGADEVQRDYPDRTAPSTAQDGCEFFEATSHNLCGNLAQAWNDFGGLAVFGYPLTEPFEEDGMTVQYFERARFETAPGVWPARDDVLLGRLGAELVDRELAQ